MYQLAEAATSAYKRGGPLWTLATIPDTERVEVEERAAIAEFDGNLSRDQAERLALDAYLRSESRH